MPTAKRIADLITWSRAALALALAGLGLARGAAALPLAAWITIANWTGDVLDGAIARRSRPRRRTWIGEHDLEVDMLFAGGLLAYLLLAGYVEAWLAAGYVLVWAAIYWRCSVPRSLGMLAQAPIYAWFIWVALHEAPGAGWWLVAWIAAAVAITWPRFPREVVPGFVAGIRQAWPWPPRANH